MHLFNVTYEFVAPDVGDVSESGFVWEGATLREAIEAVQETRTRRASGVTAIEANEFPVTCPRWITIHNGMEFETGACESRSLHMPDTLTPASRRRIARLLGTHGA